MFQKQTDVWSFTNPAAYMSPEQVRGYAVDARTDTWAFGCLLYEMLTGTRAFAGHSPGDVLAAVVADDPAWVRLPASLPRAVGLMLRGCLQKDPERRSWTAAEARRTLEASAAGEQVAMSADADGPQSRSRWRAVAAVVGALIVVAGAAWMLRGNGATDQDASQPLALAEVASLVALPPTFEGAPDERFRGVHRSLSIALAGMSGMSVKEPPSEIEMQRFGDDSQGLARVYGVDAFLRTTVLAGGAGTTLSVRLVDPASGRLLWGREFSGEGPLERQLQRAVSAVHSALRPGAAREAESLSLAQIQYQRGRSYSKRYNATHDDDDYERAYRALETALDLDPRLAGAAAELAFLSRYRWEDNHQEAEAEIGRWSELALRTDQRSGLAWAAYTLWEFHNPDFSRFEAGSRALKGARLAPDEAMVHFILAMSLMGMSTELAAPAFQRAIDLDPLHLHARLNAANNMLNQGILAPDRAVAHVEHARRMQPGAFQLDWLRTRLADGDLVGARAALETIRAAGDQPEHLAVGFGALVAMREALADQDEPPLRRAVEDLIAVFPRLDSAYGPEVNLDAIGLLARNGRFAEAERVLAASLANPWLQLPWDVCDSRPDLQGLRDTPPMREMLRRSREELEKMMQMLGEARASGELPEYLEAPYLDLRDRLGLNDDAAVVALSMLTAPAGAGPSDDEVEMVRAAGDGESYWPRWRGPSGQGLAAGSGYPDTWSGTDNVIWRRAVPGAGNSSPIVWADRIFLTSAFDGGRRKSVLAFDRATGEPLWEADAPVGEAERPYPKNGHASGTPVTDGERVYAYFGAHGLLAVDLSGRTAWHRDLDPIVASHGTAGSPLLYRDRVIVYQDMRAGAGSFIAAFDAATGDTIWWTERPENTGWGTPVAVGVGDRDEIVVSSQRRVVAYDPDTGAELWSARGNLFEVIPTPVVGHGLVFASSGRAGPTLAIRPGGSGDVTDTHVAWSSPKGSPFVPSTLVLDEYLYMINDMSSVLTVFEAATGEVMYQGRLGEARRESFSASPVAVDGKVFLTNDGGETFVVAAGSEFKLLHINRLGEQVRVSPALVDGRWYIRTAEHLLAVGDS